MDRELDAQLQHLSPCNRFPFPLGGHNERIANKTLGDFQRWVIRKSYTFVPFEAYDAIFVQLPVCSVQVGTVSCRAT